MYITNVLLLYISYTYNAIHSFFFWKFPDKHEKKYYATDTFVYMSLKICIQKECVFDSFIKAVQ